MIDGFGRSLLASSAIVAMVAATPAQAQTKSFDVAAQPAQTGVAVFGKQADIQIVAARKHTAGKQTNSVRGAMNVEEGLRQLLAGTGLTFKATGGQTYMIVPLASAAAASGGAGASQGQAVLVGSVRDHTTGAALKGALVEVVETGEKSSTGDLGDFRFARLPTGDMTLRISYLGFPEQTETVSIVGGLTNRADVYLGSGMTTEIVVIGQVSARAQALNQERTAENSTTVISGDLLGNFNGTTISDSLRRAPGVSFQQNSQTGDGTNIIVRGLSPDYNQVNLNGIALPEGSGTGRSANLGNILSDSVSEIRISKTLLASQDSAGTGGLVEIETKSPLDRPRRYFNMSVDGTKRGKGFGKDYMVSGTVSGRFGAGDQFGISLSGQYRNQDIATYSYDVQGIPGAYLPLAPNGDPATLDDLDPRLSFPFYEAGQYYASRGGAGRNLAKAKTLSFTVSSEWQVDDSTSLRLDYVHSQKTSDTLDDTFNIRSRLSSYFQLIPVPAENGELRYVYGDRLNQLFASSDISYARDVKEKTDALSFRGTTTTGKLTLDYRAGYSRGSLDNPQNITFSFDRRIPVTSAILTPDAVDPATGTVVTLFGPRVGRGFAIPLLSAAGYEALANAGDPYFLGLTSLEDSRGRSSNLSGRFDAKYEFGGGFRNYLEAGLDFKRSKFSSSPLRTTGYFANFDPDTFLPPQLTDIGLDTETIPFGRVSNRDAVYQFVTKRSLLALFSDLGQLSDGGYGTFYEDPRDELIGDQYTQEDDLSGFVQGRVDIGKLEVIGGVRINRVKVRAGFLNGVSLTDANGVFDQALYDRTRMLIEESQSLTSILPRVLANYRPSENIVVRAGYYSTVARPQIAQLSQSQIVALLLEPFYGPTGTQPTLVISRGNPGLKPAVTHNFDVGAEWYDRSVGVMKLNFFYKRINNLLEANSISGDGALDGIALPDDPRFQNLPSDVFISVSYPVNNPDPATIWGLEAALERRLDFLPGVLSGLGVYANYTYTKSKKTETQTWSTSPIYENGVLVGREAINYSYRTTFNQSPAHSGTAGLTYSSKAIDASLYYTMQARRKVGNQAFNLDLYDEAVSSLDFRADYRFHLAGAALKISVEGLNLLKGPSDASVERSVGGVGSTPKYYTSGRYFGGRSFALGLSATF